MKLINIYASMLLLCAVLISCEKRHVDDNIPSSVINLSRAGVVNVEFYDVVGTYVHTVYATNAGFKEGGSTKVNLVVSQEALNSYNTENQTNLKMLPATAYILKSSAQNVTPESKSAAFDIEFNCIELAKLGNLDDYVLPVSLTTEGSLSSNPKLSYTLIHPNMLGAELKMKELGLKEVNLDTVDTDEIVYTFDVFTEFDNKWQTEFEIVDGQDAVMAYNALNNTIYQSLPANSYTIEPISKLVPGESTKSFKVTVNKLAIPSGVHSLAIQLKSANMNGAPIEVKNNSIAVIRFANGSTTTRAVRTGWSLESFDSQGGTNYARLILDGNHTTFWQPAWLATHEGVRVLPYSMVVNMGSQIVVDGFEIWRRPDQNALYSSDLKAGYFEVSTDGQNWKMATTFDCGPITVKNAGPLYFYCETVTAKYVRITITESNRLNNSNIAEFYTLKK